MASPFALRDEQVVVQRHCGRCCQTCAWTAGARASASITAKGAPATTAGARASASITAAEAPARTAGARASASITARGASARTDKDSFHQGLEVLGLPHPDVLTEMRREFLEDLDSMHTFTVDGNEEAVEHA